MAGDFDVTVRDDSDMLRKLSKRMRAEEDGKALRKDLIADIRTAVQPGVQAVQGKLRSIPAPSGTVGKPPLGTYLAVRVRPQVRLSGRSAGVSIKIGKTPGLRGFTDAAKHLNRGGWRHRVFGRDVWVDQTSPIPGFFDDTLDAGKAQYRAGVLAALRRMAIRLAGR